MSNPITKQEIITTRSIRILNMKTGIVILVGSAARLVTSDNPIATNTVTNKNKLVPASNTAIIERGVITQP